MRNRAFEDSRPPEGYTFQNGKFRNPGGFDSGFTRYGYTTNGVPFWSVIQSGAAKATMQVETTGGITPESAYCLRVDAELAAGRSRGDVANEGFFAHQCVREDERNTILSLHARGE